MYLHYVSFIKLTLVLLLLQASTSVQAGCAGFSDIDNSHTYCSDIKFAYISNWIDGYRESGIPTGKFGPNNPVSREEFTKILVNAVYDTTNDENSEFYDYRDGYSCFCSNGVCEINKDQWSSSYICFAKNKGVIKGDSDGRFHRLRSINLAEALKIALRAYGFKPVENDYPEWSDPYINEAREMGILSPFGGILVNGDDVMLSHFISRGYATYLMRKVHGNHTARTDNHPELWNRVCDAKDYRFNDGVNPSCFDKWAIQIWYEIYARAYSSRARTIVYSMDSINGQKEIVDNMTNLMSAAFGLGGVGAASFASDIGGVLTGLSFDALDSDHVVVSGATKTFITVVFSSISGIIDSKSLCRDVICLYGGMASDVINIANNTINAGRISSKTKELNNVNITISYLSDYYSGGRNMIVSIANIDNYVRNHSYKNVWWWVNEYDKNEIYSSISETITAVSNQVGYCHSQGKCFGQKARNKDKRSLDFYMIDDPALSGD